MVTRSKGQSAIARAAYIAREKLIDERTGRIYDYRLLDEPEWKATFAPENAPPWAVDRQQLWNAVERREDQSTRPDQAQLARDFKIALPHELNFEQRRALVEQFARELADKGMVVDIAMHFPDRKGDQRNFHVHILTTMRDIGPEGFGNKNRSWNRTEELERWRERWSELGAMHLERAGFHQEAERFRHGHLTLTKQRQKALERGDHDWAEKLDRAPLEHMGPSATAKERSGLETRKGDINREIKEINRVGGIPRKIREAYVLSNDPHSFADALAQNDMLLARIAKRDVRKCAEAFAFDSHKYTPLYREGEYVVTTEQGAVYRLTPVTTGANFRKLRNFLKPLDQQDYPALEAARAEMKKRSLIPKLERSLAVASADTDRPRTSVPIDANMPHIRGAGSHVWWAYNSSKTPESVHQSLAERGFALARVTAEDARDSHTQHWAAKRQGGYHPILHEGEYIAVSERGSAYRFNERSVGHNAREVRAFMARLDDKPVRALREVEAEVQSRRIKEIDPQPYSRPPVQVLKSEIRMAARRIGGGVRGAATTAGRAGSVAGSVLDFGAALFESLFAPAQSPGQKEQAQFAERERQPAAVEADRRRNDYDRDR